MVIRMFIVDQVVMKRCYECCISKHKENNAEISNTILPSYITCHLVPLMNRVIKINVVKLNFIN
jgi:hypothetical protein